MACMGLHFSRLSESVWVPHLTRVQFVRKPIDAATVMAIWKRFVRVRRVSNARFGSVTTPLKV